MATTPILPAWRPLVRKLVQADERLAPIIRQVGPPRLKLSDDPFRSLSNAILSQQLAVRAAETIIGRFRALGPTDAKSILRMKVELMRTAGVSGQKASYLKSLAERWQDRAWRRGWGDLRDEALVERLTEVKGVGEWTAHMFLIFSLGRPDVLPHGDFGVRKGLQLLHRLPALPLPKDLPALVPHWKGMASVGAWYLWRGLDSKILVTP